MMIKNTEYNTDRIMHYNFVSELGQFDYSFYFPPTLNWADICHLGQHIDNNPYDTWRLYVIINGELVDRVLTSDIVVPVITDEFKLALKKLIALTKVFI